MLGPINAHALELFRAIEQIHRRSEFNQPVDDLGKAGLVVLLSYHAPMVAPVSHRRNQRTNRQPQEGFLPAEDSIERTLEPVHAIRFAVAARAAAS